MSSVSVDAAIEMLKRGELVAIPTETVYGLAGRFDRDETLKQIFSVKGRPFFDPLIVHVADTHAARTLTQNWPEIFDVLAEAFWPGPLTLVADKASQVSSLITSGLPTVALRCPRHPVALSILKGCGTALAAPSANLFGHTSPTSASHVEQEFDGKVAVVDGGKCEVGVESTVVSAHKEGESWNLQILRPGGVSRQELIDVLNRKGLKFSVERTQSPATPGHLPHHYQPSSPLVIVEQATSDDKVLNFLKQKHSTKISRIAWLQLGTDPRQAARSLYQSFRDLSGDQQAIAVQRETSHNETQWEAIWDRIQRASSFTLRE